MTQNSINNEASDLTIDPGASGDSAVQFSINATPKFIAGVDDTDGDSFKISQGSALGTNDTMVISEDGEINLPLQPAFLGYLASTDANVTGGAGGLFTLGTVTALTEVFDIGGNFTTAGVFTAPVTGNYILSSSITFGDFGAGMDITTSQAETSNRSYRMWDSNGIGLEDQTNGYLSCANTVLADMDALDTAYITGQINGGAGNTADVIGSSTLYTYFSGYLAT